MIVYLLKICIFNVVLIFFFYDIFVGELSLLKGWVKLEGDKVFGSDGFIMVFFDKCWDIVKDNFLRVFEEIFGRELRVLISFSLRLFLRKIVFWGWKI